MNQEFELLGLAPAQAKVLDILVKQGQSSAIELIRESKISASNVYLALEKLKQRGIVTKLLVNERPVYKTTLSNLKTTLGAALDAEHEQKRATLEKVGELITSTQIAPASQDAEIFIGIQNLRTAHARLFSNKVASDEFVFFYKYQSETGKLVHDFFSKMDINNFYKNIRTRALFSKNYKPYFSQRNNAKFQAKFTDQPIPSSINIYQDKTLIIHWSNTPTAYLITSKEIATNFLELFNDIWNMDSK